MTTYVIADGRRNHYASTCKQAQQAGRVWRQHASNDRTASVAREYGAKVIQAVSGVQKGAYATDCKHDWILCLLPTEILTETLEASLFEWKTSKSEEYITGYAVSVRKNGAESSPELRLVNRTRLNWQGIAPDMSADSPVLQGELLRFDDTDEPSATP